MISNDAKISVIVPVYAYNEKLTFMTAKCIESAKAYTNIEFELIIVETCSNYFSEYADIHIYEKNRTTSTISINRAFSCCKSDYVVLLTNDVMVSEGWLEALIEPFNKFDDCGVSTLASNQFNHKKENRTEEGIWGSVFMVPQKYAKFDGNYINSWEDSDLWMQVYSRGYKMYRNFKCVVEHNPGQTHYQDPQHQVNYENNRSYFTNKWKDSKLPLYQILTKGYVV